MSDIKTIYICIMYVCTICRSCDHVLLMVTIDYSCLLATQSDKET